MLCQPNVNCDNWAVSIWREAYPVVKTDEMNSFEGGEPVYTPVPQWTVVIACICAGGGFVECEQVLEQGELCGFACEECP